MNECKPLTVGDSSSQPRTAGGGRGPGRAVQVDPIKPTFRAHGTKRLKLINDGPLSNFAFNFNLRRYSLADPNAPDLNGSTMSQRLRLDHREVRSRPIANVKLIPPKLQFPVHCAGRQSLCQSRGKLQGQHVMPTMSLNGFNGITRPSNPKP